VNIDSNAEMLVEETGHGSFKDLWCGKAIYGRRGGHEKEGDVFCCYEEEKLICLVLEVGTIWVVLWRCVGEEDSCTENIKQAKGNKCSQYKKYCCDFFLQFCPFARFIFTLSCLGMF
jgi:hypothetical protein